MKNNFKLQTKIVINKDGKKMVEYTCVDCGERNKHFWFKPEIHICTKCEKETLIRGEQKV